MSALTSTIQNYIYPPDKFSRPKKNYIKENMKLVKKMHLEHKEKGSTQKCIPKRLIKRRNEEEKLPLSDALCPSEKIFYSPVRNPRLPPKEESREQGCQTSTNDLDGGKIRFPRNRPTTPEPPNGKKNMSLQVDSINDLVFKSSDPVSVIAPSYLPIKDGKVDFVRLNMVIAPKKKQQTEKYDPSKAPPNYQRGVIPKYLRESKRQHIEEVQEKGLVELIDELDEHNYSLVPEEEKKERLREIRLAYAELVTELNSLPFRSDSPKIQAKREQIETALQKLEDGIKLFSRERLYLKPH